MLKRLSAILLLALLAFNWFGYKLYIGLLEQNASVSLQNQLDRGQYDASNLVEVRLAVNLPYLSNWSAFENYSGETEINGVHYNYVKRKSVNDTLILLCIPNQEKNHLKNAQSDYYKQVNDLQTTNKKTNSGKDHGSKSPVSDYLLKEYSLLLTSDFQHAHHFSNYLEHSTNAHHLVAEQPPEC